MICNILSCNAKMIFHFYFLVQFFYWIAFTGTKEFHDSRILIRAALFLCQRCSQFQICFFCFTDWICWSGSCKLQIGSEKLDLATNRGDAAFMFHLHIYRIEKQIPYEALNKKKGFPKTLNCICPTWIQMYFSKLDRILYINTCCRIERN